MILTHSDRIALELIDYVDNTVTMTSDELKNIRENLRLTQEGLAKVLNVGRGWITRCESDKGVLSYAHAMILRMLNDLREDQRVKWINVAKRKTRTPKEVGYAIEDAIFTCDNKTIAYFKKNGYKV